MKQVAFFLIFLFTAFYCKAELIHGIVFDKQSNKPISYVSIGIINSPFGTYSNMTGQFKMNIVKYKETDTLRFSCIGFNSVSFKVSEFIEKNRNGFDTVYLTEKITELDEIVVYGKKIKTKIIGNRNASKQVLIGFLGDKESGIIIKNDKNLLIREVSFKLAMTSYDQPDSAIFRFNIYSLKDDLPEKNLLNKPIYFYIYKGQFDKLVSFDIRDNNIQINDNFAATFELIKQYGGSRIYFAGKIHGCKGINRYGPQGEWTEQKADGGPLKLHQSLELEVIIKD